MIRKHTAATAGAGAASSSSDDSSELSSSDSLDELSGGGVGAFLLFFDFLSYQVSCTTTAKVKDKVTHLDGGSLYRGSSDLLALFLGLGRSFSIGVGLGSDSWRSGSDGGL